MSGVFFTSDLHLGHVNCAVRHRGFASVEEHNETIISNIIQTVGKRSKLFVLGDVGHNKCKKSLEILSRIPCDMHLIMGNHDQCHVSEYLKYFKKVSGIISYNGFWVTHCPIHPNEFRGKPNIHGHVHGKRLRLDFYQIPDHRYFNVNIDVNNYLPVPFEVMRKQADEYFEKLGDNYVGKRKSED